jgi:hypothetical protein
MLDPVVKWPIKKLLATNFIYRPDDISAAILLHSTEYLLVAVQSLLYFHCLIISVLGQILNSLYFRNLAHLVFFKICYLAAKFVF